MGGRSARHVRKASFLLATKLNLANSGLGKFPHTGTHIHAHTHKHTQLTCEDLPECPHFQKCPPYARKICGLVFPI